MSFVSVLPFGDTLAYWWRELEGDPGRLQFMAVKLLEVSAFLDNRVTHRRERPRAASTPIVAVQRPPNTVPVDPFVVVVVPVYCQTERDACRVDTLLGGIAMQSIGCETVIVDDGSPRWRTRPGAHVIRVGRNGGPAAARNLGLDRAVELGADVVAFIDSDCVPVPDWIANIVSAFRAEPRAHAISGATWSQDRSALGRYQERNGTLNGRRLRGEERLLYGPTCNLAVSADLARGLRFDESFPIAAAEDIEFCYRANLLGWSIYHAGAAVVRHDYGYDDLGRIDKIRCFWSQFRRYSRGERRLLQAHPEYDRVFAGSTEISLRPSPGA